MVASGVLRVLHQPCGVVVGLTVILGFIKHAEVKSGVDASGQCRCGSAWLTCEVDIDLEYRCNYIGNVWK